MAGRFFSRRGARTKFRSQTQFNATAPSVGRSRSLVEPLESRVLLSGVLNATAQLNLVSTTGTTASPVYNYNITVNDTGTTPIGTFWLSWIPGGDFMPSVPLSHSGPAGWGAGNVTGSGTTFDGSAIMWIADSGSEIAPAHSLSGFDFSTSDSPTVLAGLAPSNPTTPILTSFVYIGAPFGDPGLQFTVAKVPVAAPAAKLAVATQPTAAVAGKLLAPTVTVDVKSAAGTIVTSDSSKVTLSVVSGPAGGTLSGTASVLAVKGIATFSNLKFTVAGTYTLKATDGILTSATAKPITITAASAAKLVFGTTQPATGIAGKALTPALAVKVEDAFGNIVVANTSTVTLTRATGPVGSTLAGTLSVKAIKGVATFSAVSMKVAGAYTLKATDAALTAAVSKTITIVAAAAAKLVITQQPITAKTNVALVLPIIVKVEDAFGNVALTNTSAITLAIATGPVGGSLGGILSVRAVKGMATFSNLSFKKAGGYTLKAIDGLLTAAVSKAIGVS